MSQKDGFLTKNFFSLEQAWAKPALSGKFAPGL
jgi:hypothetical protein